MTYGKYIILLVSSYALYEVLYNYRKNIILKVAGVMAALSGLIVAVSLILEEYLREYKIIIENITALMLAIVLITMFFMFGLNSWLERKNSKERIKLYILIGFFLFSSLAMLIVLSH